MSKPLRVLSVYEGFFRGGARIMHSATITALHTTHAQQHAVFSIHDRVERENTMQHMRDDKCYKELTRAGIEIVALNRSIVAGKPPSNNYSDNELATLQAAVDDADIILTLKEQSLDIINQIDTKGKPVLLCVHRSDPENQGVGVGALHESLERGTLTTVVCNGESSRQAYTDMGVPSSRTVVIKNGIDLKKFIRSSRRRARVRTELSIPSTSPVICLSARYDTMKNIPLFLASASAFYASNPSAHFIMCGAGMTANNPLLALEVRESFGKEVSNIPNLHLLGIRDDMPAIYASTDIVSVTSSFGETYCLCLLEGIACGAVPVATDVGDTREIVGSRGLVTSDTAENIAASWHWALVKRRQFLRTMALTKDQFDEKHVGDAYATLLRDAARLASPHRVMAA